MASPQKIGTLTITSGQQDSTVLSRDDFGKCRSIAFICQEAALTGTVTVEIGNAYPTPSNWATLQSPPGTDVTVAADKVVPITAVPFPALRLHSSVAEGGTRVFDVWGEVGE